MLSSDPGLQLTVNPQGLGALGARLPGTSLAIWLRNLELQVLKIPSSSCCERFEPLHALFIRRQRLSAQNRERRSTGVRRNLLFWLKLKCDVMFLEIDVRCCYVRFCNFSVKGQKSGPEAVHHGNTRTGEKTAVQCKLHNCRKSVAISPFALSSFCFHTYRVPKKLAFVAAGTCLFPQKTTIFWGTLCVS